MEAVVSRIASGEARILVGTQMVTKGHDFPSVTLVVVLNADQGLFSTDFRAPERLAQTIIQVAGRAGRGTKPGEVLIQTEYPEHPLLQSLLKDGYDGFARAALNERAAAHWPPFAHVVALRASATALAPAVDFLRAARQLRRRVGKLDAAGAAAIAEHAAAIRRQGKELGVRQRLLQGAHRCIGCSMNGCRAWKRSRRRAICAGRSTWIRSTFSSYFEIGQGRSRARRPGAKTRVFFALGIERRAFHPRFDDSQY